jgi:hypothetical protein
MNSITMLGLISKIDVKSRGIRVITKLPNSEQSYKGKVKTHKYIKSI